MSKQLSNKVKSTFIALVVIFASTAIGVTFADLYLATDRNSRAVRADVLQIQSWFGGLDVHIVTIASAVIILVGIAIYARNRG